MAEPAPASRLSVRDQWVLVQGRRADRNSGDRPSVLCGQTVVMRRLGQTLLVFAVLLLGSWPVGPALAARATGFAIRDASGTITLSGTGSLAGLVGSGEVWVSDQGAAALAIVNAESCIPEGGGEDCSGTALRVQLLGKGTFVVRFRGSRLSLASVGYGFAAVQVTNGTYLLGRGRPRSLPHKVVTLTF
jgi:hypothetical protein